MRKKRTKKLFLKAFKITNSEGKFTEEDFERLTEKFEIIRELYFHEEENHDYFDSFRAITKEIKRAAHNAGLNAKLVNLEYKYTPENIKLENLELTDAEFNAYVLIKSADRFKREDNFVVTALVGICEGVKLRGLSLNSTDSYSVDISQECMNDELLPTYVYSCNGKIKSNAYDEV